MDRLASFGRIRGIDQKNHEVTVVASTEAVARDGMVILSSAWQTDEYDRNPVVLWAHDAKAPPIARAVRTWVQNRQLMQTHEFNPDDPVSMQHFQRIVRGVVNAVSVRWDPLEHRYERRGGKNTLVFTRVQLQEVSYVSVPSDPGAIVVRADEPEVALTRSAFDAIANGSRPPARLPTSRVAMRSQWERAWTEPSMPRAERDATMAANFQLAGILFGARDRVAPARGEGTTWGRHTASEDFLNAWREHMFTDGPPEVVDGNRTRAMDTQETGFGLELAGSSLESTLWEAARSDDILIRAIPHVRVFRGAGKMGVDVKLPELLLVDESIGPDAAAYPTRKWQTTSKENDPAKLTINAMVSADLAEDALIEFVPTLRRKLTEAHTLYMGSAVYNGDQTLAATGNINLDDSTPSSSKHYLAWDGIRHSWLVNEPAQGANAAGAITDAMVTAARARIGDVTDSIDELSDVDWSERDLLIVCDRRTHSALRVSDLYERGEFDGIPVISPSYAARTEDDGKLSETTGGNVKGQLSIIAPRGWRIVQTGGLKTFVSRVQRTDQFLLELYTRAQLHRWSDTVAAGIRNITV